MLCIAVNLYAQQRITFIDSSNHQPIPAVLVHSYSTGQSRLSDSNGQVDIINQYEDSFYIQRLGYQKIWISILGSVDTIYLVPISKPLREVKVISRQPVTKQFGEFRYKRTHQFLYHTTSEFFRKIPIENQGKTYKLRQVMIPMGFRREYRDSCFCQLHVYRSLSGGLEQLEDILTKPIVIRDDNIPKKFLFDLSDQDLFLSDSLLIVGLDCYLNVPFETRQKRAKFINDQKHAKAMNLSPIYFYFQDEQLKNFEELGLSFQKPRVKGSLLHSGPYVWYPALFNAGLVLDIYD